MSEKITRRQLRAPDKFMKAATGWVSTAREHPRETIIASGGLVLALLIIGFLFGKSEIRVDPVAGGALSDALNLVDRQVGEGLEGEETFATEEEKRGALLSAFSEVRSKHRSKPSGLTATLALADLHFEAGEYDEALALYDDYLERADSSQPMRPFALEGRALSLEAKGDIDGALAAFNRLESETSQKARALYGKARLAERQEKWEEARSLWQSLKDDHAMSPLGREANSRLARLEILHPAPAAAQEG